MKVSELMAGITVNPDFTGFATNDDYVLAINISGTDNAEAETFEVLDMGVSGLDAQLNPITQDKIYIRAGQSTTKTGLQRTFAVSGDRYVGDPAQDFCLGYKIAQGTGNDVIVDYVYFCMLNGKGETGKAAIIVNSDASGSAGENATFSVDLKKSGLAPTEYTYTQP